MIPPSSITRGVAVLLLPAALSLGGNPALSFEMQLPLNCEPGKSCEIQHYVDRDPGSGSFDYQCGSLTYDGHKGTDFRLPSLKEMWDGVDVLSVASGRVLRVRDEMDDVSVRKVGVEALKGQDCGNGLVIAHGDGWETQYCHLRLGSIVVRPGEQVEAGDVIGRVGLSGKTEFPHVHVTLRKDGEVVDPFDYQQSDAKKPSAVCSPTADPISLWTPNLRGKLTYKAGEVLNAGFADRPVSMADIESGELHSPGPEPQVLVAYARAIGLRKGDIQHFSLIGPDGATLVDHKAEPLDNNKAQNFRYIGRKRPEGGWQTGTYRASYRVERDGQPVLEKEFSIDIGSE